MSIAVSELSQSCPWKSVQSPPQHFMVEPTNVYFNSPRAGFAPNDLHWFWRQRKGRPRRLFVDPGWCLLSHSEKGAVVTPESLGEWAWRLQVFGQSPLQTDSSIPEAKKTKNQNVQYIPQFLSLSFHAFICRWKFNDGNLLSVSWDSFMVVYRTTGTTGTVKSTIFKQTKKFTGISTFIKINRDSLHRDLVLLLVCLISFWCSHINLIWILTN